MFSCCVPTPRGFCSRKPWRERIFRFCRHWFNPQPQRLWSFRRKSLKVTTSGMRQASEPPPPTRIPLCVGGMKGT